MAETISVIIPAYNAEKYIRAAIQSVLDQTHPVHEIIIVDDGSTDGTRQAVEELQKTGGADAPAIRYIYQQNQGPAVARNTGITAATGGYIAFLDSDDTWLPRKAEKQVDAFKQDPVTGLVCTGRVRIEEQTLKREVNCLGDKLTGNGYKDLWEKGNFITTSSVIAKKECFEHTGLFDVSKDVLGSEDMDMWYRIAERYKVTYINEPLVQYLARRSGFNRSNIERAYASAAAVIQKHQHVLAKYYPNDKDILRRKWSNFYWNFGLTLLDCRDPKGAHIQFKKNLGYSPFSLRAVAYYLLTLLNPDLVLQLKKLKQRIT